MLSTIISSIDLCHTFIFIVVFLIFTFPPAAITSSGLTFENIFHFLLGSEYKDFISYHIRRSALTLQLHSFLFLIYYITICATSETMVFLQFTHRFWQIFFQFSLLVPVFVSGLILYWYQNKWERHPITRKIILRSGCLPNQWREIAENINQETRVIDKFVSGGGACASHRLLVTENWLLLTSLYGIQLAHHHNDVAMLEVRQCNNLPVSHEDNPLQRLSTAAMLGTGSAGLNGSGGVQFLRIAVVGRRNNQVYFHFQVSSVEYEEIKGRITAPMRHAKGVIVELTLGEQFIKAFENQVKSNVFPSHVSVPRDYQLESCIGCSEQMANVKLVLNCRDDNRSANSTHSDSNRDICGRCLCRPMWCLSCLGRWFASRQLVAEHDPSTWMSRKASCPTCRTTFCVLDVVLLPEM